MFNCPAGCAEGGRMMIMGVKAEEGIMWWWWHKFDV
jgi:hypothetical protein